MRLQVYWIVFSGLNVFEQFGLLPIIIGNALYASACLSLSLSLSLPTSQTDALAVADLSMRLVQ